MQNIIQRIYSITIFAIGLSCLSCASLNQPEATTATLSGRVRLSHFDQKLEEWEIDEDMQAVCNERLFVDESVLLSSDLGLAGCVVSAHPIDALPPPVPLEGVLYEKVGPRYVPRVLAVTTGTEVLLRNRNSPCKGFMARTVYAQFNRTVTAGTEFRHTFERRGVVPIGCDLRMYMRGVIVVLDTNWFAMTDAAGHWQLDDLPPGDYQVRVWHERMKKRKGEPLARLTVTAGERVTLDYEFELPE